MTPASPVARRLPMLGLASLCAAALVLSACGGGGSESTTTEKTAVTPPRQRAGANPADDRCQAQVGGFLKSMARLRGNLAVGLSYEQYAAEMHGVRAAYDKVPVGRL